MALPASDVFSYSNGELNSVSSGAWVSNAGTMTVDTGGVVYTATPGNDCAYHWTTDTFGNDHYSQATVGGVTAGGIGVAVRCAASGATYYGFYGDVANSYVFKQVSGTWTQLGSNGASAFAATDVVKIEAEGTTLTPTIDGSGTGTPGAQTDSAISAGQAGICGYFDSAGTTITDWTADDLAGGATAITGTAAGVATAAGDLYGIGDITATAAGVATAAGDLIGTALITATADGVAAAAGDLTPSGYPITATSDGVAAAAGAITGTGVLEGTIAGVATATAAVSYGQSPIVGAADGVATVVADAVARTQITVTAAGVATATGNAVARTQITGTIAAGSSVSGAVDDAGTSYNTTTIRPDSADGTVGSSWSAQPDGQIWSAIDDDPDSPNESDYAIARPVGAASEKIAFVNLSNMPSDFQSMYQLSIKARVRGNSLGEASTELWAQVYQFDETTPLSAEVRIATLSSDVWSTVTFPLTGLTAGNRATWDGAKLRMRVV